MPSPPQTEPFMYISYPLYAHTTLQLFLLFALASCLPPPPPTLQSFHYVLLFFVFFHSLINQCPSLNVRTMLEYHFLCSLNSLPISFQTFVLPSHPRSGSGITLIPCSWRTGSWVFKLSSIIFVDIKTLLSGT